MTEPPSDPPVVLITGGSSGIGRATARAFGAEGWHVALVARGAELLADAVEEAEGAGAASATAHPADVLDEAAVDRAFEEAVAQHGRIDVVVHAAMVMAYGTIEDLPLPVIDRVVDTATHGTARVGRAALRQFRAQGHGSLVIVTSLLASVAVPGIGAYVVGKWAQGGLARTLRLETADAPDIHVTTVAPGAIDTPIYRRAATIEGHHGTPPPPVDPPDKVAAAVLRAAARPGSRRVSVGKLNALVVFGFRFATPLYERLVGPLYRRFALDRAPASDTDGNVFAPTSVE